MFADGLHEKVGLWLVFGQIANFCETRWFLDTFCDEPWDTQRTPGLNMKEEMNYGTKECYKH